jgi:hypothetical protein
MQICPINLKDKAPERKTASPLTAVFSPIPIEYSIEYSIRIKILSNTRKSQKKKKIVDCFIL